MGLRRKAILVTFVMYVFVLIVIAFLALESSNLPAFWTQFLIMAGIVFSIIGAAPGIWSIASHEGVNHARARLGTPEVKYLVKFQVTMKKDEAIKADLFRKEFPLWVDLEKGYVVEPPEVGRVVQWLKERNGPISYLIEGTAASGKSTIAKTVGYRLASESKWNVFAFNAERLGFVSVDSIVGDLESLPRGRPSLIIIDDVHLMAKECEELLKAALNLKSPVESPSMRNTSRVKLLFTTRPSYKQNFSEREPPYFDSENLCKKISISEKDSSTVSGIIDIYTRLSSLMPANADEKGQLTQKCGGNLWVLKYLLKNWKPGIQVSEENATEEVTKDLQHIRSQLGVLALQILMELATFYQYQIPIEATYVTMMLPSSENVLNRLTLMGEIKREQEAGESAMVRLCHSSLADLYYKAWEKNHGTLALQSPASQQVTLSLSKYIITKPHNYDQVINRVYDKGIPQLFDNNAVVNTIEQLLEQEQKVFKIASCLSSIAWANKKAADGIITSLKFENLESKLEKEKDLMETGISLIVIDAYDHDIAERLVESFNVQNFSSRLENEPNPGNIGTVLMGISSASMGIATELVESLDFQNLLNKLRTGERLTDIGSCIQGIGEVNEGLATKLGMAIIGLLPDKVREEPSIATVGYFIHSMRWVGQDLARMLTESLDVDDIRNRIGKEQDVGDIAILLGYISDASELVGRRITESLDLEKLRDKLEKERDAYHTGKLMGAISKSSNEVAKKLVGLMDFEKLRDRVGRLRSRAMIVNCIADISLADIDVALKLASDFKEN